MFGEDVETRLELLEESFISISDHQIHLTEKEKQGSASLQIELRYPCILFHGLEKKKPQYFKNQKCSDYVMFEYAKDHWLLHIFELKRSVGISEWKRMKEQFLGALQNALALAGVLHIEVNWNDKELVVDFLGKHSFVHQKIQLNIESGEGIFQLLKHRL